MGMNSKGGYRTTAERTMAAYDKLPPSARKALQEAAFHWATQPILTRWNKGQKGYRTGHEIADTIAQWDRADIAKAKRKQKQ